MTQERPTRVSLIDGSVETVQFDESNQPRAELEPILEEFIVQVLTVEGPLETVQKRVVGFRERKE